MPTAPSALAAERLQQLEERRQQLLEDQREGRRSQPSVTLPEPTPRKRGRPAIPNGKRFLLHLDEEELRQFDAIVGPGNRSRVIRELIQGVVRGRPVPG